MTKQRDVIVIGAGISGASAALQAARVGLNVIALTKPNDPGYWARTRKMHHIPGLPENTTGSTLIEQIRKQAEPYGVVFHDLEASSIQPTETRTFKVMGGNGDFYEAPIIIIATGVSKDEHFLAGERELIGKGVFYSVENEAPSLKHQNSTVIGKSEEAAKATLYLAKFAEKIFFVIPSSKLDVSDSLFRELEANKRIELLFSSSIKKLNGENELHSVTILSAGNERELKTRSAFIYTYNLKSRTEFTKGVVEVDKDSERILVNSDFSTSRPGIFACGDVLAGTLQNPAISTAQGIVAAINAEKYLRQ